MRHYQMIKESYIFLTGETVDTLDRAVVIAVAPVFPSTGIPDPPFTILFLGQDIGCRSLWDGSTFIAIYNIFNVKHFSIFCHGEWR